MKKMRTLLLASAALLAVASLGTGLSAVNVSANTSYTGFEMDGASVRAANPVGIRFHTVVPEALKVEGNTFGTLIIPKATLGDNTLDVNNTSAANVAADKWQSATEFTAVLGGVELGGVIQDFDAANYNSKIVARSYVKNANGEVLYYTAEDTRTVAQVAAYSLADPNPENQVSDPTLLETIVHTVLGEDKFELVEDYTVTVADEIAVDTLFSATNGNEGLTAIWTTSDENTVAIKTDADGFATAVVPKAIGTATLTAKIGDYTAQIDLTVADETLAAPTNLAIDRSTGTLSWNAVEGAKSYDVSVSSWKTGNTVYSDSVTGNSVKFTENAGDIYTVSVNAVATFGTDGTVATEEIATYTPANASKDYMLFDFENEASLDITKSSTWKGWSSATWEESTLSVVDYSDKKNVLKISNEKVAFAGVTIKLPTAISIEDFAAIRLDYNVAYYFNIILSDGTNMLRYNYNPSTGVWKNVQFIISDFATFTTNAPTQITEIYLVKNNNAGDYYFDNIEIVTCTGLDLNFNVLKEGTTNEYYVADFTKSGYERFLSGVDSNSKYEISNGYLQCSTSGTWKGVVTYTLPKTITGASAIKFTIQRPVGTFVVWVYDANGNYFYKNFGTWNQSEVDKANGAWHTVSVATNGSYDMYNSAGTKDTSLTWDGSITKIMIRQAGDSSAKQIQSITYTKA